MRWIIGLSIINFVLLLLYLGCQSNRETPSFPTDQTVNAKSKQATAEVSVGGKTWKIDPSRSYRATGVWINPNPRPLTDTERARLETLRSEIETLEVQLAQRANEVDYLERIEKPDIKIHYSFGMPLHKSSGDVIDLGEFPMEMENFNPSSTTP